MQQPRQTRHCNFYPRSPCGERQGHPSRILWRLCISIHALLAESDMAPSSMYTRRKRFLSTLSLRRATHTRQCCAVGPVTFLSTLSLRRATDVPFWVSAGRFLFLSTLSLRRATHLFASSGVDFSISIHALLAESDQNGYEQYYTRARISIHALLAESDREQFKYVVQCRNFYPRSPCGERRNTHNSAETT